MKFWFPTLLLFLSKLMFSPQLRGKTLSFLYTCASRVFVRLSKGCLSLPMMKKKKGGRLKRISSCYHDGETLTDLQKSSGVIFLTASNSVFFFFNITYQSNRKQVWSWNTPSAHHHISPHSHSWLI